MIRAHEYMILAAIWIGYACSEWIADSVVGLI